MADVPRKVELIGGPYHAPPFHVGDGLFCEIAGRTEIFGFTGSLISWPYRRKPGTRALILCGSLIEALRIESADAIAFHWGVSRSTIANWRSILCIKRTLPNGAVGKRAMSPDAHQRMAAEGLRTKARVDAAVVLIADRWINASEVSTEVLLGEVRVSYASVVKRLGKRPGVHGWAIAARSRTLKVLSEQRVALIADRWRKPASEWSTASLLAEAGLSKTTVKFHLGNRPR